MSRYTGQLRFPSVCAKCLAPSPTESWKIGGSTSGVTILLRLRTTRYSLDVPICVNCKTTLRRAYNMALVVAVVFFLIIAAIGRIWLASPYPPDEISTGIAAIISYFIVSIIIYPVAISSTGAKIGKISGSPPRLSFDNPEYHALYKAINPFG